MLRTAFKLALIGLFYAVYRDIVGYVLGLILEACILYQQQRKPEVKGVAAHPDPIHISAHFLRSTAAFSDSASNGANSERMPAPFEVRVRTVKVGKGFTNLAGELVQGVRCRDARDYCLSFIHFLFGQENVNVMAHFIFGNLSTTPSSSHSGSDATPRATTVTLLPPLPNARVTPLRTHPRDAAESTTKRPAQFKKYTTMREDGVIAARNANSENGALNERPGLEWGSWLEMPREEEGGGLRPSMIPFLADSFKNLPQILPKEEKSGLGARFVSFVMCCDSLAVTLFLARSWFPTMQLSIEFKAPIPRRDDRRYSSTTVGLYSLGRFMQDPSGR